MWCTYLVCFTIFAVFSVVEEPLWYVELQWIADNRLDVLNLLLRQLAGALVQVNVSLLQDQVAEAPADTADAGQSVHGLVGAADVGVEHTQNELELCILDNQCLQRGSECVLAAEHVYCNSVMN